MDQKKVTDKFEEVVQKDKELASIALEAIERADGLAKEARRIAKLKKLQATEVIKEAREIGGHEKKSHVNHSENTQNIPGITMEKGKFKAIVSYTNNDIRTTKTAIGPSLKEAVIKRNQILNTLFAAELIDIEKFRALTIVPEGAIF